MKELAALQSSVARQAAPARLFNPAPVACANRALIAVSMKPGAVLNAGRPAKVLGQLVDTSIGAIHATHYAVSSDGQRFFVNVSADVAAPTMVVQNWTTRLTR